MGHGLQQMLLLREDSARVYTKPDIAANRAPTGIELGCADRGQPCKLPNAITGDPPKEELQGRNLGGNSAAIVKLNAEMEFGARPRPTTLEHDSPPETKGSEAIMHHPASGPLSSESQRLRQPKN